MNPLNTLRTGLISITLLLIGLMIQPAWAERGELKQVFGNYEVHYIGLTSSFIDAETAAAYDIPRSRNLGYLSVSVLHTGTQSLPQATKADITGTMKNLIGQTREIEFREIVESGAVYYISTFDFYEDEVYRIQLQVTPEGQNRTFDVNFSQKFYEE